MEKIIVKNAYENNLKHLNLEIPLDKFTCVTGCSGCGKSSLVFDTIYAESQRAFLEGMTGNIYGQKLMDKPHVGSIENLRPTINISQNCYNVNPRSTIGTTTEISYYIRSLFALVNNNQIDTVSEKTFSANNPNSFCYNCSGLGVETVVSESLLVPDRNVTLRDGAILYFKGPSDGKEQKILQALCEHYNIDIDKKFSELSNDEAYKLLYSDDQIRYKLVYKVGKKRKQHYVMLRGAIPDILSRMSGSEPSVSSGAYNKYMEEITCHVCCGSRFKKEILEYKVGEFDYNDVESMELTSLSSWVRSFKDDRIPLSKTDLIKQIKDSILFKLDALIELGIGYLCLKRSIPTLSDGERQRVRIATQLTCSLKCLIYILDEPCKGLHYRDVPKIIMATRNLINRENTVIAIEHNKQYIGSSDNIIELGPVGGPDGGYLIKKSGVSEGIRYRLEFKKISEKLDCFNIKNINFRNIHRQNASFPIGKVTCITGVSGSGKSTLASVVVKCFSRRYDNTYGTLEGGDNIRRIIQVDQSPIGKTPRSTVVSYLEIFDEIRKLLSGTEKARHMKIGANQFSMNIKGGRCECCQGTGLQKIELNYLPSSYIKCPECEGKRFNEEVLSISYSGKNIYDILETPIYIIINIFSENKKIYNTLNSMIELGLGYLKLGQMSMNLSGGEAQRIKLAKALSSSHHGKNLYVLDEPTSGLNDLDINRFIKILYSLQQSQDTVIIIEHNIEFIARVADYIIDFGLKSGKEGGKIIASGQPEKVFNNKNSSLYDLIKLT